MSGKKVEERYKTRNKNSSNRGYASQRKGESQARYSSQSASKTSNVPSARQRDYDDRSSTRRKGRAGCLVSLSLLVVVMIGLYILIFKTSVLDGKNKQTHNESLTPTYTQYIEHTPTPTPKPEATAVPTPTPEPVRTLGYISTEDEDGIVRMRQEANSNSGVRGELNNREVLYILGKEGDYYKIRHRGDIAYVYNSYVVEGLPEDNMLCDVISNEISYSKLVEVTSIIPDIMVEMPYATHSNHVNKQMYPFELVLLQETTAQKLKKAQETFIEDGYTLVIWDAYRPYTVTVEVSKVIDDTKLAAGPETGSKHNRGAAIDVTLYNVNTNEYVDMPTKVREMDKALVSRDSTYMTYEQRKNMEYMERVLGKAGFSPYQGEWWHYNDMNVAKYPVLDIQFEAWEK